MIRIAQKLEGEEAHFFYWAPVFFGLGIVFYFFLPQEPSLKITLWSVGTTLAFSFYLWHLAKRTDLLWYRRIGYALALIALGFFNIKYKTDRLSTPQLLGQIGYSKFEGTIENIQRLPRGTRVILEDVTFTKKMRKYLPIPTKIRLTLKGRLQPDSLLMPGQRVHAIGSLRPPSPPITPGSYDFRQRAYFQGIGAVGYALAPLELIKKPSNIKKKSFVTKIRHGIAKFRTKLTDLMRKNIPGQSGAIMAALVTGDRSGIKEKTRQAFADPGIAHILAISGLHLSLVAGLIFLLIRGVLSFIPFLSLNYNIKKIAAGIALLFTLAYLIVSGMTIPAQRAFIMTGLILLAVMVDRIALTLRNVSLAALLVLIFIPDALMGPSFQLSFAAVIALVAFYEKTNRWLSFSYAKAGDSRFPLLRKGSIYITTLLISSLLATLATMPFTIFTFNRFSLVALVTNLMAIPLMSFVLMPLIVLSLLLTIVFGPLALTFLSSPLSLSLEGLQHLSFWGQSLPGAIILVPAIPVFLKVLCILGLIWMAFMQTSWRFYGLIPISLSVFLLLFVKQPDVFIPQDQNLMGFYDQQTKKAWTNTNQSGRFARKSWLQQIALKNHTKISDKNRNPNFRKIDADCYHIACKNCFIDINHTSRKRWRRKVNYIFLNLRKNGESIDITPLDFRKKGGHFIFIDKTKIQIKTVKQTLGNRPWSLWYKK